MPVRTKMESCIVETFRQSQTQSWQKTCLNCQPLWRITGHVFKYRLGRAEMMFPALTISCCRRTAKWITHGILWNQHLVTWSKTKTLPGHAQQRSNNPARLCCIRYEVPHSSSSKLRNMCFFINEETLASWAIPCVRYQLLNGLCMISWHSEVSRLSGTVGQRD